MRQRSGCKSCRERHIKCVKLRDSEKCKYCSERKRPCIRGNAFRFRPVTAVKFNAGEDIGSAEQSLEFRGSETWVNIPSSLRFIAPNTDGDEESLEMSEDLASEDSGHALQQPTDRTSFHDTDTSLFSTYPDRTSLSGPHHPTDTEFHDLHRVNSRGSHDLPALVDSPRHIVPPLPPIHDVLEKGSPNTYDGPEHHRTNSSSLLSESLRWPKNSKIASPVLSKSPQDVNISPYSSTTFTPNSGLSVRWPVSNAYEAGLLHHYLVYCTNWIDVCDPRRHFEKEVPKRAAHFPVILNGILGLAARHLWLMGKTEEDHSQPYVDQCLQALIVGLEDPLAHWDENFLVAVILMRLHEEMGDSDDQCHHFGTARILNSISSFAADGDLREAASWVSLRQHIYVSLTTQQPLNLSLDNYRHSSVFREFDDESWANRIIFQFATILQHVFEDSPESSSLTRDKWAELDADVDEWERTKPWTFTALYIDPNAGKEFNGSWPVLPTAQGVVAVGLQYYHLCKILLSIYSPHASLVGLAGVRARRATDAAILRHIRIIIGYGVSNSHCGNAMFQGSHILSACGAYVTDKAEQEACVEYLKGVQQIIGWKTDNVLQDLREQWLN
ncbi:hypothetical protein K505DRAFT_375122 [Melanomma pulvis-pyrius CBS 109.77]|uniref:Zn(2)-C6 fungal-type domain-containing protein n=1 Tax=Melanomma pulvis-pyrius CBS 109.77 TaxID=1314802 RepID=A0A6A6XC88_9PLEO|nr:hypothetical protein K505DRAFT_375122 [Melanomma pulvis-pyrius CBS 109.77]